MSNWSKPDKTVVLASNSPRRREILSGMGIDFTIVSPSIDDEEKYLDKENVKESIEHLSLVKAKSVAMNHKDSLIIGSDTLVFHDKEIIGKPKSRDDAFAVLKSLSGSIHQVYTGVALLNINTGFSATKTSITDVYFRNIDTDEIEEYLNFDEYLDKAGAYAIQSRAMTFVERIDGCFYNVMGLPIKETIDLFTAYMETMKGQ